MINKIGFKKEDLVKVLPSHDSYSELQGQMLYIADIGSSWAVLSDGKQVKMGQALELKTLEGKEIDIFFDAKDIELVDFTPTHSRIMGDETALQLYLDGEQVKHQCNIKAIGLSIISCCNCDTVILYKLSPVGVYDDNDIVCHGCKEVINPNDCSDLNY